VTTCTAHDTSLHGLILNVTLKQISVVLSYLRQYRCHSAVQGQAQILLLNAAWIHGEHYDNHYLIALMVMHAAVAAVQQSGKEPWESPGSTICLAAADDTDLFIPAMPVPLPSGTSASGMNSHPTGRLTSTMFTTAGALVWRSCLAPSCRGLSDLRALWGGHILQSKCLCSMVGA